MRKQSLALLGLLLLVAVWVPTRVVSSTGNWESYTPWKNGPKSSSTSSNFTQITVAVGKVSSSTVPDCKHQGNETVPLILFLIERGEGEPILIIGEVHCVSAAGEYEPLPEIIPLFFFIVPEEDPPQHYQEIEEIFPLSPPQDEFVPQDSTVVTLRS